MPEFAKGVFAAQLPAAENLPLRLEGGRVIGSATLNSDGSFTAEVTDQAVARAIEEPTQHYSLRDLRSGPDTNLPLTIPVHGIVVDALLELGRGGELTGLDRDEANLLARLESVPESERTDALLRAIEDAPDV